MGEFPAPDGLGRATISCGDSMQMGLRVAGGRILEAAFMTDGCGPVVACGDVLAGLAQGTTVGEAMALGEEDLLARLPDVEMHCATLAVTALRRAILDYLALQREPWKKAYRQVSPFQADMPG